MKLKDLIFNREKLRKYDELKEWREKFAQMVEIPLIHIAPRHAFVGVPLPDNIKQIILSALDAEIQKLDEE